MDVSSITRQKDTAGAQLSDVPMVNAKVTAPMDGARFDPARRALTHDLLHEVNRRSVAFRAIETDVSVLYWTPHGFGSYILANSNLPDVLRPSATDMRQADAKAINANPNGVFEWHLLLGEVQRVVSFRIAGCGPPARFWAGRPKRR
jgi:hypothetical protein